MEILALFVCAILVIGGIAAVASLWLSYRAKKIEADVREMYAEGELRAAETAHTWPGTDEYKALHQILDEDGVYSLSTMNQVARYQTALKAIKGNKNG